MDESQPKSNWLMDFFMVYGWAILIIVAALLALLYFGVINPQHLLPKR
jgi:cytoskeletal protein RodZ